MAKLRIAFFGLGTMGTGMAGRLLAAGHEVTVYNRNRARADGLAAKGALVADTPGHAAANADAMIAMLADDEASRSIWLGENGALAAARPGSLTIDCSTVTVPWIRELAVAAAEHKCKFLDAPVTGSKGAAANGELTFLVGGDAATLEIARPILAAMSKQIVHVGPTGAGAMLKLINNFVCGVELAAFAEARAMIQRAGLDAATAIPILTEGAPGSPLLRMTNGRDATGDKTVNFQLSLLAKDLQYAIREAHHLKMDLATAPAALALIEDAMKKGLGSEDLSALIGHLRK